MHNKCNIIKCERQGNRLVITKIRSWSNMPIIVLSARSEDFEKIGALDAGADDYLTKTFSVEELLARLRVAERRLVFMQVEQ